MSLLARLTGGPQQWSDALHRQMRRVFRRWAYACVGFAVGIALVWLMHADALQEVWHTERSLDDLRSQLALPAVASGSESGSRTVQQGPVLAHLPGQSTQARLWPALQQSLGRHHLQLLSLRPVGDQSQKGAPLPSQVVALRLRGRFGDWVRAWAGMDEGVPVWSMEHLRISPLAGSEDVEVDVVLRVWLRTGADGALAWTGQGGTASGYADQGEAVFGRTPLLEAQRAAAPVAGVASHTGASGSLGHVDSPNPVHWPWAHVRLMGIWQEAGARHAILVSGSHWVRAHLGQQVSQEGHRLESIGDQAVHVRVGQGPLQVLNFEKGSP